MLFRNKDADVVHIWPVTVVGGNPSSVTASCHDLLTRLGVSFDYKWSGKPLVEDWLETQGHWSAICPKGILCVSPATWVPNSSMWSQAVLRFVLLVSIISAVPLLIHFSKLLLHLSVRSPQRTYPQWVTLTTPHHWLQLISLWAESCFLVSKGCCGMGPREPEKKKKLTEREGLLNSEDSTCYPKSEYMQNHI